MQSPSHTPRTVFVNGKPFTWDPTYGLDLEAVCELKGYILKRVWSESARSAMAGVPMSDVAQDAYLAATRAAALYHPDQNASFMTYAKKWIDGAIKKSLRESLIRTPEGKAPIPVIRVGQRKSREDAQDTGWEGLETTDASVPVEESVDAFIMGETIDHLTLAVAALPPEQAKVLRMYRGLGGQDEMTFDQIARQLGITLRQAQQMHRMAYETISRRLHAVRGAVGLDKSRSTH